MLECANKLEAQETIIGFDVVSFGNTDKKGREKLFKRYHKIAVPENHKEKPLDLSHVRSMIAAHSKKIR